MTVVSNKDSCELQVAIVQSQNMHIVTETRLVPWPGIQAAPPIVLSAPKKAPAWLPHFPTKRLHAGKSR